MYYFTKILNVFFTSQFCMYFLQVNFVLIFHAILYVFFLNLFFENNLKIFSARMKFDSERYAQTTGLTFQQISHRALEDFIDCDDRGGFHLNHMFFEARKLWHLVVAEENGLIDRKFHDKRLQLPLYLR